MYAVPIDNLDKISTVATGARAPMHLFCQMRHTSNTSLYLLLHLDGVSMVENYRFYFNSN